MDFIDEKIEQYVHDHTQDEGELLARLKNETYAHLEIPHMLSGRTQGRLLKLLAQLLGAQRIVDRCCKFPQAVAARIDTPGQARRDQEYRNERQQDGQEQHPGEYRADDGPHSEPNATAPDA